MLSVHSDIALAWTSFIFFLPRTITIMLKHHTLFRLLTN